MDPQWPTYLPATVASNYELLVGKVAGKNRGYLGIQVDGNIDEAGGAS